MLLRSDKSKFIQIAGNFVVWHFSADEVNEENMALPEGASAASKSSKFDAPITCLECSPYDADQVIIFASSLMRNAMCFTFLLHQVAIGFQSGQLLLVSIVAMSVLHRFAGHEVTQAELYNNFKRSNRACFGVG